MSSSCLLEALLSARFPSGEVSVLVSRICQAGVEGTGLWVVEEKEEVRTGLETLLEGKAEVLSWWVGAVVVGDATLTPAIVEVVKSRPLVRLKKRLRWPIRLRVFQGFVGRELGFSLLSAAF